MKKQSPVDVYSLYPATTVERLRPGPHAKLKAVLVFKGSDKRKDSDKCEGRWFGKVRSGMRVVARDRLGRATAVGRIKGPGIEFENPAEFQVGRPVLRLR